MKSCDPNDRAAHRADDILTTNGSIRRLVCGWSLRKYTNGPFELADQAAVMQTAYQTDHM